MDVNSELLKSAGDRQYLRERVDHIADTLSRNTVILEQNTESLKEHMQQTALIAKRVTMLEEGRKFVKWLGYILGLIATVAGAILAVRQLLGKQ